MKRSKLELEVTPWIPGMAGVREPVVENALKRFHLRETQHRTTLLKEEIDAANREIHELKIRIAMARKTLWFYASSNNDLGTSAKTTLGKMTMSVCPNFASALSKDKAEECAKMAGVLTVPFDVRAQYRLLGQEWTLCAEHAEMCRPNLAP